MARGLAKTVLEGPVILPFVGEQDLIVKPVVTCLVVPVRIGINSN